MGETIPDVQETRKRGHRVASVVGGVLLVGASVLWVLFWGLIAAWIATDDSGGLGGWVFLAGAFSVGVVCFSIGIFLVVNRFPRRWGWLVVGALAALPVVPAIAEGLSSEAHVASVTSSAAAAYAESRGGPDDVAATCTWEDDGPETWRCQMNSARVEDVCFVEMTREDMKTVGRIDRCESDGARVAHAVGAAYRRSARSTASALDCWRQDSGGALESWRCDPRRATALGFCFVDVRWSEGSVSARIATCHRELADAVSRAYSARIQSRDPATSRCVEDEYEEGRWICRTRVGQDRDTCVVGFTDVSTHDVRARISYCEREASAVVDPLVARVYAKRTVFDPEDVTATCALRGVLDQWICAIRADGQRDRCEFKIHQRPAGPKVVFWATTCSSGRL